jgi:hypothetical protein
MSRGLAKIFEVCQFYCGRYSTNAHSEFPLAAEIVIPVQFFTILKGLVTASHTDAIHRE